MKIGKIISNFETKIKEKGSNLKKAIKAVTTLKSKKNYTLFTMKKKSSILKKRALDQNPKILNNENKTIVDRSVLPPPPPPPDLKYRKKTIVDRPVLPPPPPPPDLKYRNKTIVDRPVLPPPPPPPDLKYRNKTIVDRPVLSPPPPPPPTSSHKNKSSTDSHTGIIQEKTKKNNVEIKANQLQEMKKNLKQTTTNTASKPSPSSLSNKLVKSLLDNMSKKFPTPIQTNVDENDTEFD